MSSPLPPDPYAALGVAKDVEFSAIRSAYRKLALLHHPDRIKDEALREKGKDEFQKIQRAWELLGDAEKRQRYDDRVRLAELRKESMMRDSPQRSASTANYSTRPAPAPASQAAHATNAREYREDGNYFEEVRQPRNVPTYDEPYTYDEPSRTTSRKYPEYEKRAPAPKTEKKSKAASSFAAAGLAAQFASKLRTQAAEKSKSSRAEEKKSDREKKRERTEKVQTRRTAYVGDYSSDSDHTEVRPSMRPSSRSKTTSDYPRTASSKSEKPRELDEESFDGKWEKHHDDVKAYISKASNRPSLDRSGSDAYQYWAGGESKGRKSGSDNEKRPNSSKGRRTQDDYFTPPFTKSTSSPNNLRAHIEERAPPRSTVGVSRDRDHRERDRERERDRGRDKDREHDRDREHRKVVPPLSRSHTTPMPRSSSKKDSAPSKGSNLKHGEAHVHDSSYSSSSSPQTPEMREQSPPRTSKGRYASTTSTKYQIVDPEIVDDEGARAPRIAKIYPDEDRYARYHSPEPISREAYTRETDRRSRDKPDRPKVDTSSRSKSSRGAAMMQEMAGTVPPLRRGDSGHHTDSRASPRSPRDTPPLSRHDSGREKLFMEVSPEDRYNRAYPAEKANVAPRRDAASAKYANYTRDAPDLREAEYRSRFPEPFRARRPSVY
jgi:curved DNA-binding protein CbpA